MVEITLISPEDFEYEPRLTDKDRDAAKAIDAKLENLQSYYAYDSGLTNPGAAS